jgi:DNA primase
LDLDPQPGTDFGHVREAAREMQGLLDELGIVGYPKTTGNIGLHVYVRLESRWDSYQVRSAAVAVARELERRRPDILTAQWWKEDRGEAYSSTSTRTPHTRPCSARGVRARPGAQVSTPIRWDEIEVIHPDELTIASLPARIETGGDPWVEMNTHPQSLEPLLAMHERDQANGLLDAPWPPVYPKQPGEPPRVSRTRARKS